jgi:hypothetical protein
MTVERLLEEMPADEFFEWCAFFQLEPWGYEMDNWRMGVVSATVANAAGRKKPLKPSDFMPKPPSRRKLSVEEAQRALSTMRKKKAQNVERTDQGSDHGRRVEGLGRGHEGQEGSRRPGGRR